MGVVTWTKIGDDFNERTDLMPCSRSARLLYVELYVFANRLGLDGRIPRRQLRKITDADDAELDLKELIEAGTVVEDADTLVLDWSDQEDAETVRARRERRAEVQKAYRDRVARHAAGDHSRCDPRYCKKAVTGNATGNKSGHKTPSRPVPSRPKDRGQGQGATTVGADAPPWRPTEDIDCPHRPEGFAWHDGGPACADCRAILFGRQPFNGSASIPLYDELELLNVTLKVEPMTEAVELALQEHAYDNVGLAFDLVDAWWMAMGLGEGSGREHLDHFERAFRHVFGNLEPRLANMHEYDPDERGECRRCNLPPTSDLHVTPERDGQS